MQNMCSFGCLHPCSATFSYYLRPEKEFTWTSSQVSEHQAVSFGYDAPKKWGLFWTMFMVCYWQSCPWKLGKWWTWVPCKYIRRELLHFGQGFVGEPKVSFPGPVPALKSTAVAWHSHPTWNSIELVKWTDLVHDISFSKSPRNLVSSGYDFPLSTIF